MPQCVKHLHNLKISITSLSTLLISILFWIIRISHILRNFVRFWMFRFRYSDLHGMKNWHIVLTKFSNRPFCDCWQKNRIFWNFLFSALFGSNSCKKHWPKPSLKKGAVKRVVENSTKMMMTSIASGNDVSAQSQKTTFSLCVAESSYLTFSNLLFVKKFIIAEKNLMYGNFPKSPNHLGWILTNFDLKNVPDVSAAFKKIRLEKIPERTQT